MQTARSAGQATASAPHGAALPYSSSGRERGRRGRAYRGAAEFAARRGSWSRGEGGDPWSAERHGAERDGVIFKEAASASPGKRGEHVQGTKAVPALR